MGNPSSLAFVFILLLGWPMGCGPAGKREPYSIRFTQLPPMGEGSPDRIYPIEGVAKGLEPGQAVVLYARSGVWWVQPTMEEPYTTVDAEGKWKTVTHPGSAYGAMIVKSNYRPPMTLEKFPPAGENILFHVVAEGAMLDKPVKKSFRFSGYEWIPRDSSSDRGGTRNRYDPENVFVDSAGHLHLRMMRREGDWTSSEIKLTQSLGYGTYRFVVRDISHLEPTAVFSLFTWGEATSGREMDIEIGRWGEMSSRNAQYVVQPYYVPANVIRFEAPAGRLTHTIEWEPGRARFRTWAETSGRLIDEHQFTSGVPSAADEAVYLNLYRFETKSSRLQRDFEVIVEKFEYLP